MSILRRGPSQSYALILYGIGRVLGLERAIRWLGKLPLVDRDDFKRAAGWFDRRGKAAIFFGRLVPGVGSLISLPAGASRMMRSQLKGREVLSSWMQVIDYWRSGMAFEEREQFRILFLDKKNALIADEVQQRGTVDHTPVYPREVVKRALELNATAIILVHNHPSGDPTPSRADIDMTRTIIETAKPLGVAVHDHIVIGRKGHASTKGLQLI